MGRGSHSGDGGRSPLAAGTAAGAVLTFWGTVGANGFMPGLHSDVEQF